MTVDTCVIDNKTYMEIDKTTIKGDTYVYLVNSINQNDFTIRKLVANQGKIFYEGLKDKNEFQIALMYFVKKHENMLEEESIIE